MIQDVNSAFSPDRVGGRSSAQQLRGCSAANVSRAYAASRPRPVTCANRPLERQRRGVKRLTVDVVNANTRHLVSVAFLIMRRCVHTPVDVQKDDSYSGRGREGGGVGGTLQPCSS